MLNPVMFLRNLFRWIRCWICHWACVGVLPWPSVFDGVSTSRTSSSGYAGGAANQILVSMPAGVQTGDLLIAAMGVSINPTVTVSAGWTQIAEEDCPGFACELSAYWRIADGTETDITFSFGPNPRQAAGAVFRYSGTHQSDPIGDHATSSDTSTTPTAPALPSLDPNSRVLWLCLANNAQRTLSNPPADSRFEQASTAPVGPGTSAAADGVNLRGSDRLFAPGGASPAVQWTLTKTFEGGAVDPAYAGDPWRTLSIQIRGGDPCPHTVSLARPIDTTRLAKADHPRFDG